MGSFERLDFKRWFDRLQPQTLQIATWLLYINGAFLILAFLDSSNDIGLVRETSSIGLVLALVAAAIHPLGGFLMANGKRLGYWVAVLASFAPFILRLYIDLQPEYTIDNKIDIVLGGDIISGAFDIALVALMLHPMSRRFSTTWLS